MSVFGTLLNASVLRRVGFWAVIQALPDEEALKCYLRAAYMGIAGVVIGSVLTGSALAVGIVAIYHLLIDAGWEQSVALASTAGFTLLLILACFALAGHWFVRVASIKEDFSIKPTKSFSLSGTLTNAVQEIADGFVEGLTSPTPRQTVQPPPRRVRLIR